MALTLSVGFVVDDAIVMLENIVGTWKWRKASSGSPQWIERDRVYHLVDDALLVAVFIPVLFMVDCRPAAS